MDKEADTKAIGGHPVGDTVWLEHSEETAAKNKKLGVNVATYNAKDLKSQQRSKFTLPILNPDNSNVLRCN